MAKTLNPERAGTEAAGLSVNTQRFPRLPSLRPGVVVGGDEQSSSVAQEESRVGN